MAKMTRQEFIDKLSPYAIKDMQLNNVAASLTIAQGALESADGNSTLAAKYNNLFGIKGTGTRGSIELLTTEYQNGVYKKVLAKFRVYNNWGESIADHSELIIEGVTWDKKKYHGVLGKDGIMAASEIAKAGYATDPFYSQKLIDLIQEYKLLQYDKKEEKKEFSPEMLEEIERRIKELENRIKTMEGKLTEIPAPDWFTKEFPNALNTITKKTGTYEFWRLYTIVLETMLNEKIDKIKQ